MLQSGSEVDLALEALDPERVGELWPQHLERHLPAVLQVLDEPHGRHAARSELADEGVSADEALLQLRRRPAQERAS